MLRRPASFSQALKRNFSLFTVVILLSLGGFFHFVALISSPGPLTSEKTVYISPGSSVRKIAATLKNEGAIEHPLAFEIGARLSGGKLKAGEYLLPRQASAQNIIDLLQTGKTHQRQISFAEGLMSVEIMALLASAEAMTGEIAEIPPEGSLLPETYNYSHGDSRAALLNRMKESMTGTLAELWQGRDANLPLKTPEEAVILASVVEKETGVPHERARVAGVFVNRLRRGMPLQSDPTVIYAITMGKEKLERPLLRKDLDTPSPYNTYVTPGLPPGPIANPGRAALEAVLHPEVHDYLYFVADGSGGHAFGKTLEEHTRNVAAWRKIQKAQ